MKLLVTGGAGFIGSNFVRRGLEWWPDCTITVLDALTYASSTQNLAPVWQDPRFRFIQGDICDPKVVRHAMARCTHVVNFAAKTHVDRSILDPGPFIRTDVEGTQVLLDAARDLNIERYLQVSTHEVYGDIEAPHRAQEGDQLRPRRPRSASRAAGDLIVGAYHTTYGVPTLITRGSNTYGPYQHPERLVPLFITNALDGLPMPVYGEGLLMREWMHVDDHCTGIARVLEDGKVGEVYNIGVGEERANREVIESILEFTGADRSLLRTVPDRPGYDRRYALDTAKLRLLGWKRSIPFTWGLATTVRWYRDNRWWWEPLKSRGFKESYRRRYKERLADGGL